MPCGNYAKNCAKNYAKDCAKDCVKNCVIRTNFDELDVATKSLLNCSPGIVFMFPSEYDAINELCQAIVLDCKVQCKGATRKMHLKNKLLQQHVSAA